MIVTATTNSEVMDMLGFLAELGVTLPVSSDLRFLGRWSQEQGMIGVVAYNGFIGRVCCMHVAGKGNWVSREFLRAAFEYPFVQAGVAAVMATVDASNPRALKFNRHLGFEVVYRIRNGWSSDVDMVLMEMRRERCRWIQEKTYGRQKLTTPDPGLLRRGSTTGSGVEGNHDSAELGEPAESIHALG